MAKNKPNQNPPSNPISSWQQFLPGILSSAYKRNVFSSLFSSQKRYPMVNIAKDAFPKGNREYLLADSSSKTCVRLYSLKCTQVRKVKQAFVEHWICQLYNITQFISLCFRLFDQKP